MKRIIVHWTGGRHKASALDRQHYHYLIEGDGSVVDGVFPVAANEHPVGNAYAAHTLNCNAGSIGVAMCCMAGAKEQPFVPGPAPMTAEQWEAMIRVVAQLARQYRIPVTPQTILSHAEVQHNLGIRQRGKWDIARLAFDGSVVGAAACGDKLRAEVRAAMGPRAAALADLGEVRGKPLMKHRRVWASITSGLGGMGSGILGMLSGWEWQAVLVMALFASLWIAVFAWLYRHEIRAGLFRP